jgi:hypothetical protein
LVGEKLKQLREEVGLHVAHRVKFSVELHEETMVNSNLGLCLQ